MFVDVSLFWLKADNSNKHYTKTTRLLNARQTQLAKGMSERKNLDENYSK